MRKQMCCYKGMVCRVTRGEEHHCEDVPELERLYCLRDRGYYFFSDCLDPALNIFLITVIQQWCLLSLRDWLFFLDETDSHDCES